MAGNASKNIVIAGIVIALLVGCVLLVDFFSGKNLINNVAGGGSSVVAKAQLTAATIVVTTFASQNGGYGGLNAGVISQVDPAIQWVDGEPATGQIGITDVTSDSYTLTIKGADGAFYSAIKNGPNIVFQDANGNQI